MLKMCQIQREKLVGHIEKSRSQCFPSFIIRIMLLQFIFARLVFPLNEQRTCYLPCDFSSI